MGAKQDPSREASPRADGKLPIYLATSDPPKPRPVFFWTMVVVTVVWIGILGYLALHHVTGE